MYNLPQINQIGAQTPGVFAAAFTNQLGGGQGATAMAGAMPFDGNAMSREAARLMGNGMNGFNGMNGMNGMQNGQQNSQQMQGLMGMFMQVMQTFMGLFQQMMGQNQQNQAQNGQNAQQNNAVNALNGGANQNANAANGGQTQSGNNINNSVYNPNGITMKPLDKYNVTSEFGARKNIWGGPGVDNHTGIDLAAKQGSPIRSFKDGVVTKIANDPNGYGNYVEVRHADGSTTRYGHMSAFGNIKVGQQIGGGSVIGAVGSTGNSTGPHLHFEVRNAQGQAINPRSVMNF